MLPGFCGKRRSIRTITTRKSPSGLVVVWDKELIVPAQTSLLNARTNVATLRFGQQRGMNEDHVREGASGVELPSSVEWWRMAQEVKRFSNEGSELQLAHYYLKATVHNLACRARSEVDRRGGGPSESWGVSTRTLFKLVSQHSFSFDKRRFFLYLLLSWHTFSRTHFFYTYLPIRCLLWYTYIIHLTLRHFKCFCLSQQ